MAMDTFMVYAGVYSNVDDAKADYQAVHDLHVKDGLIDAYDAAVIERKGSFLGIDARRLRELAATMRNPYGDYLREIADSAVGA